MSDIPPPPPGQPVPPNPYGGPQPPAYGTPAPGQPPAGPPYPGYGQPGAEQPKGKGLAITAFILAFIPCVNIVSIVLALIVLIGKKAGKGLAIAALVITPLIIVAAAVLVVVFASTPIDDLKKGQCITADGLTGDEQTVSSIQVVECDESHDAEVVAVQTLDADLADDVAARATVCETLIPDEVIAALTQEHSYTALTQNEEPDAGDHLVCVVYRTDGNSLTEKLG